MQKTFYLILSLLCAVVQVAWAQFGGGDGSAKNPYIISTTAHWNQFATDVNGGTNYSDKYFLLDADISVTTMVGTGTTGNNAKTFNGTFDGGGHTLTFNYDGSGDDIAPFRFVKNAFISNLHVAGEIKTSGRHAGGLAGRTYGTTQIVGCRVSTVINSSHNGNNTIRLTGHHHIGSHSLAITEPCHLEPVMDYLAHLYHRLNICHLCPDTHRRTYPS